MEKYLQYFYELSQIPHGSGNMIAISNYIKKFASDNGFYVRQDINDNLVIIREAHPDYANHEPVILQGHMDMVAVKEPGVTKNMELEGLDVYEEDGFLKANGTSLGGDDGIAVAYIMDILSGDYKAPRIEAIITVDEEVGMLGATALSVEDITAHRMINIDQEVEGVFLVGCAGGSKIDIKFPVNRLVADGNVYEVKISGLKGGHSGIDIDKNRGNAILTLCGELNRIIKRVPFNIIEIRGGVADNVIPSSAYARIMLADDKLNSLYEKELLSLNGTEMYFGDEKNYDKAEITVCKVSYDSMIIMDDASSAKFLEFAATIPNGVVAFDEVDEKSVESSLNTGIIESDEEFVKLDISVRSSSDRKKSEIVYKLCKLSQEYGSDYTISGEYPAWEPKRNSDLEKLLVDTYEEMFLCKPKLETVHAGLECGIFVNKIPGLQCISIGPDILDIHSTDERLPLDSAKRCFDYIVKVLEKM